MGRQGPLGSSWMLKFWLEFLGPKQASRLRRFGTQSKSKKGGGGGGGLPSFEFRGLASLEV